MECSSIKQTLLDMKSAGFDSTALDRLIDDFEHEPEKAKEAEKLYSSHEYPQHSIVFVKITNRVGFFRFLSAKALTILNAMCCTMNTRNLIQITQDDLLNITNIGNKKTIGEALRELQEKGVIAIKIKGSTRRGTVYMVNPQIATCGADRPGLEKIFWKLTGTIYDANKVKNHSKPHETWKKIIKDRTYSIGYGKQDTTDGEVRFGRINEPKIDTKKGSSGETDEPEDELPI